MSKRTDRIAEALAGAEACGAVERASVWVPAPGAARVWLITPRGRRERAYSTSEAEAFTEGYRAAAAARGAARA